MGAAVAKGDQRAGLADQLAGVVIAERMVKDRATIILKQPVIDDLALRSSLSRSHTLDAVFSRRRVVRRIPKAVEIVTLADDPLSKGAVVLRSLFQEEATQFLIA